MMSKAGQTEFKIPILHYNLLGESNSTRIDFPVMQARDVNVRNGVSNQQRGFIVHLCYL